MLKKILLIIILVFISLGCISHFHGEYKVQTIGGQRPINSDVLLKLEDTKIVFLLNMTFPKINNITIEPVNNITIKNYTINQDNNTTTITLKILSSDSITHSLTLFHSVKVAKIIADNKTIIVILAYSN